MSDAFFSGMTFSLGDGGGPEVFTALEEISDFSGFGEMLELIDVTHFGSGGSKEYIAGLGDGKEFTVACNYVLDAPQQVFAKGNKGNKGNVRLHFSDGTNTETFDFQVVYLGWELAPSNSDKNTISFTFKISGGIAES